MKIETAHLTYCTNIHPGETWPDHFRALQESFQEIRAGVSGTEPMGIGLRLSNQASLDLIEDANLLSFREWLRNNEAYVFTMNGFPYGDFHRATVKDKVHFPDWTSQSRVDYTLRLFRILSQLVPKDTDGGISTSPLSYRHWHDSEETFEEAKKSATLNILKVVEELIKIRKATGTLLHLDIEPEPDGILETGEEFIRWFEHDLLPVGISHLTENAGLTLADAEAALKDHVCLCYDVCHFAIGYEPHHQVIQTLAEKGIKIGKVQISAALKADISGDIAEAARVVEAFAAFNEPTYLHQVVQKLGDGQLVRYRDLPEALADNSFTGPREWRAHFHVPVFSGQFGLLQSTQQDILEVLGIHRSAPLSNHLEVETYTWEVLPDQLKLPIEKSIIRELNWVKQVLAYE